MKKALVILLSLMAAIVAGCYLTLVECDPVQRNRAAYSLSQEQISRIVSETAGMQPEQIVRYGVRFTSSSLKFSRKVNCCTYADMTSAVCNLAFTSNSCGGCHASSVVGTVNVFGIDVCRLTYGITGDPFFKDHDFNEVTMADGSRIYVDASMYDVTGKMCWRRER